MRASAQENARMTPFISQDLHPGILGRLELGGCHMQPDEPFPLEAVPSRVRQAMLNEFNGRRPSLREVAEIPDEYWLATPAIGRKFLQTIREAAHLPGLRADAPVRRRLTDAELLDCLESLQRELQYLRVVVRAKTRRTPRGRHPAQRRFGESLAAMSSGFGEDWTPTGPEALPS
jgi:hypothetical protein